MKCTHAEKLIPLFAGDDLPARQAGALRRHLESCANCRRIAAEFEESREWLRGLAAPQFDEAMLDDLRDSVLKEVGRIENRSRWLQWIVPGWNPQFAASMAVLLLIAIFAAYAYRGRRPRAVPDKKDVVNVNQDGKAKDSPGGARRNDDEFKAPPSPVPAQRSPRKRVDRIIEDPPLKPVQPPDQVIANVKPAPAPINIESIIEPPPGGGMPKADVALNREMTRIEFQTADPNIRIIWLTPKDSNSSLTKPNTNTR